VPKFSPKVGDLVYIQWNDHCSYDGAGWKPIRDIGKRLTASVCETAGFVIDITPECITTVASVTVNDTNGEDADGAHVATRLRKAIVLGKIIKRFK
jgi:hypothetical protein